MTEPPDPYTVAVINSNDDLLRLLGEIVVAAGFAAVTVHADEVGRTVEAIQEFLGRHNPKVVVYDISPAYPPNWEFFCGVGTLSAWLRPDDNSSLRPPTSRRWRHS